MKLTWMDQGGTFTDVLQVDGQSVTISKILSSEANLETLGHDGRSCRGTTVATNALLERTGVPVVLVTNRGLGDLYLIGDQRRAELFDRLAHPPASLASAALEVDGRIGVDGAVLEAAKLDVSAATDLLRQGIGSAAVVLLHGPSAPQEEQRLAAELKALGFY